MKHNKDIDAMQKKTGLKNMYFNRYLMIRYFLAILFFSNVYWFICLFPTIMSLIPGLLFLLCIPACFEIIKSYGKKQGNMKWTIAFFRAQLVVNMVCIVLIWTVAFNRLLPFLTDSIASHILGMFLFLIGILMSLSCLRRLQRIENNTDKQLTRIKEYEKTTKLHI